MSDGVYLRGEVYWVRDITSFGSEEAIGRPAVVLSSNAENRNETVLTMAYTTTSPKKDTGRTVKIFEGARNQSWVLINQIITVDKSRVVRLIGRLTREQIEELNEKLSNRLDLLVIDETEIQTKEAEIKAKDAQIELLKAQIEKMEDDMESLKEKLQRSGDENKLERELWQRSHNVAIDRIVNMQIEMDVLRRTQLRQEVKDAEKQDKAEEVLAVEKEVPPVEREVGEHPVAEKTVEKKVEEKPKKPRKPRKKEVPEQVTLVEEPPRPTKINVNTATAVEIKEFTGMSQTVAFCITGYRKKHGNYKSLEELVNVQRFSKSMLERYRDKLEV